jgi:SNF2 family DNA or RNA helicase
MKPSNIGSENIISRFSSRQGRLSQVYLKDRLKGAKEYLRIAGYFRSSIFELVHEEISQIDKVRIVCNSDLDPRDIDVAKVSENAAKRAMLQKWNGDEKALDSMLERGRYAKLYEILTRGNVEIRVVSREDAPFLHGKAGIINRGDGDTSAFIGSINETAQGWMHSYEIIWEDRSQDAEKWVREEFEYLWKIGRPLSEAIVEEIGRCAKKVQVALSDLAEDPVSIGKSALVESPIYRRGEQLMPWQKAFVSIFSEHRERYGQARLLLADEVGVGKTLSMATAGTISALLGDGPCLILCPATLGQQWQIEMLDKLGVPTALWLSNKKVWQDPYGHQIRTRGPEDIAHCPYKIGIVSTGLITQNTKEVAFLKKVHFGTVILDEAHKARKSRALGKDAKPGNLLKFMLDIAPNADHIILGTATPIQTDPTELWDLMEILNRGSQVVLGDMTSRWRRPEESIPIITGEDIVLNESDAWSLVRNPLPSRQESPIFDSIRSELQVSDEERFTKKSFTELDDFTRDEFNDLIKGSFGNNLSFFQYNNPISRHVILRRRKTLEDNGLMPKIAVDIWPNLKDTNISIFSQKAVKTNAEFDAAYEAVELFTKALRQRTKGAGFMQNLLRQRICSSIASGLSTAKKLVEKRKLEDSGEEDGLDLILENNPEIQSILNEELYHLNTVIDQLGSKPTDPKLDAILYFLRDKEWLKDGCIIFSQYYDTAYWVASNLSKVFPNESVAVYGGAGKSGVFFDSEWRTVDRNDIKDAVRDYKIRLVVATDAACEGLNLQTLGTLINVDLPWNPSRLEQRIGRIKRYGQKLDRVRMANLVYQGTVDEKVYEKLSERMQDRYDILGSLPDVIEDEWIEDISQLEEELKSYTRQKKSAADVFQLRYGDFLKYEDDKWELCEKVLDKDELLKVLGTGW